MTTYRGLPLGCAAVEATVETDGVSVGITSLSVGTAGKVIGIAGKVIAIVDVAVGVADVANEHETCTRMLRTSKVIR